MVIACIYWTLTLYQVLSALHIHILHVMPKCSSQDFKVGILSPLDLLLHIRYGENEN